MLLHLPILVTIAATAGVPSPLAGALRLPGYARSLSGEPLRYHSFHALAVESLLTRATSGAMAIEWETAPAPARLPARGASFVWIGAYATGTSGGERHFDLSIDGRSILTFTTHPGAEKRSWTVAGADGVTLSFRHVWSDHVGDAFGYLTLDVPSRLCRPGEPLRVGVVARRADSRDWYMTFKYAMAETVRVVARPAIVRTAAGHRQLADAWIDYVRDRGTVEIWGDELPRLRQTLTLGLNVIELALPVVDRERDVGLRISVDGRELRREVVRMRPVAHRDLYILPHSHNDIGYTDVQEKILDLQVRNLSDALALSRKTAGYPPEAQFRWNAEILWAVEAFLERAAPEERDAFVSAVRSGHMGLQALFTNPLTGLSRPEQLIRLTDYARRLQSRFGFELRSAMVSDIPGFSWGIVPALAHAGVRYFSSGPNSSDRIGHSTEAWGDRPFWWVSPSGEEKLLLWVAGKGYSHFHQTLTIESNPRARQRIYDYLAELEGAGYPYQIVQLRYTVMSDNGPVDPTLPDFVKRWNERHVAPRLVIATSDQLFAEMERRHGDSLPAFAGDFTPYWEDGAASTAREQGAARLASERLVQAEVLASVLDPGGFDAEGFYRAWRAVNLWDEHTWGAWNSVSDPDHPGAVAQWTTKQAFALEAERSAQRLLEGALRAGAGPSDSGAIDVLNTASWERTDLVVLPAAQSATGDAVRDASGRAVPSQRLSSGELAFLAVRVPPLGAARYSLASGPAGGVPSGAVTADGLRLGHSGLQLAVDPATGAIASLVADGRELVDAKRSFGANEYLYVPGVDPAKAVRDSGARICVLDRGPLVGRLVVESTAPGCRARRATYTMVAGLDRLEIANWLDKTAVRDKEAAYFAFPFAVPEGVVRLDLGWGFVRPGADQLPGACQDFLSGQRWVDVSNQAHGVTLAQLESPLVAVGAMVDESGHNAGPRGWRTTIPAGSGLFSYILNNYWHTNYKADQDGPMEFHYALRPHGTFNATEAYHLGIERSQPLLVRAADPTRPAPVSLLTVEPQGVVVTSILPSEDQRALLVRLYNAGGRPEDARLRWGRAETVAVFRSAPDGRRGERLTGPVPLPAFGLTTLRCEREPPSPRP